MTIQNRLVEAQQATRDGAKLLALAEAALAELIDACSAEGREGYLFARVPTTEAIHAAKKALLEIREG